MIGLQVLFWISILLLFYSYVGYGLLLGCINLFKKKKINGNLEDLPPVTLVIAGYNEAVVVRQKIENCLFLDYPKDKLSIIFVSDGSTDDTNKILKKASQIQLIEKSNRQGKAAALNSAMQIVQTPYVVFTDANSILNKESIKKVISHFADEKVGAVAGEKKIVAASGVGEAEGLYWQYESLMKKIDAQFYTVLSATGELFAMRTNLFQPLKETVILDDFSLSLNICLQGYQIEYEPAAYSVETATPSIEEEKERKIRIAAGAFQVLAQLSWSDLMANGKLFFQFISRRWMRWVVCPFAIIVAFFSNLLLVQENSFYYSLFILQIVFYTLAIIGYALMKKRKSLLPTTIPFYFLFMNYCMIKGWLRFKKKKQTVLWQKIQRQA